MSFINPEPRIFLVMLTASLIIYNVLIFNCQGPSPFDSDCEGYINGTCDYSPICNCELNGLINIFEYCATLKIIMLVVDIITFIFLIRGWFE